jgi:DNA-nicking Smr family endonuclease
MQDTRRLSQQSRRSTEVKEETSRQSIDSDAARRNKATGRIQRIRQDASTRTPAEPGKLDKHMVRRIKRGAQSIEARLDLHGMTQKEAHADLRRFIRDTAARGCRCVLVITGKGSRSGTEDEFRDSPPGVLRRVVPQWLAAPDLSPLVAGIETALPQHGGAGALYVQLRRRQPDNGG